MNSNTDIAELFVDYGEGFDGLNDKVARLLETVFAPTLLRLAGNDNLPALGPIAEDPEAVAQEVARILFKNSRAAAAGLPDPKMLDVFRSRLLEFVQTGMPIEAQMLWSPKKHWVFGTESSVDLAELIAFQTLVSIDSAVRSVYRPGMSFVIDFEDLEFQFMEGETEDVINTQEVYISGVKCLVEALGLRDLFIVRRISDHAQNAEELFRWRRQMSENYRALEAYWWESEAVPVESWETLASVEKLRELGWKGLIPPEMRQYYLGLVGGAADPSNVEKVDMVLRNLATILLHYQADLLRGSGKINPIKFSFVRSAAGAPATLQEGRVDIRFASRKLCSRVSAAAPWSTKGFVCDRGKEIRIEFRGWRELADAPNRFDEGWLTIGRHDVSARVRADFLVENGR